MNLTPDQHEVVQKLRDNQQADLRTLIRIAGLDPATDLVGADFRDATFGADDLSGCNLSRADLRGADLSRARGLDRAMFADVITDARTLWPQRRTPLPGNLFRDGPDLPEMVLIPPGSFTMGVPQAESAREKRNDDDARPQHAVTFRRGFCLGRYPVTRGEFAAFVADTQRDMSGGAWGWVEDKRTWEHEARFSWHDPGFAQTDRDPVVCVSYTDAAAYARWLSGKTGKRYRLPSEAQWEYAARAGTTTARFWGDDRESARRFANVADLSLARKMQAKPDPEQFLEWDDGFPFTSPVGSFEPNSFGLHDMLGNVWEWVSDPWHDNYQGAPDDGSAWTTGGSAGRRVLRGGSWNGYPRNVRAGHRFRIDPGVRLSGVGFRLSRTL